MTRLDADSLVARLRAAGCVYAEEEAALLLEAATGSELEAFVQRRVTGEPLEYVVGWARFCGRRVAVSPGVFVPRRRTELLIEQAVDLAPHARVVVDLCCGSGALGLAFAERVNGVELHAADIEEAAVACARDNLHGRGQVHHGDLFDALPRNVRGRVDVLIANTPYVPSADIALLPAEARDHEPRVTLDGGEDGLALARRVVDGAAAWLAPGGWVFIEVSDRQAPALRDHMESRGLAATIRECIVTGATRP